MDVVLYRHLQNFSTQNPQKLKENEDMNEKAAEAIPMAQSVKKLPGSISLFN